MGKSSGGGGGDTIGAARETGEQALRFTDAQTTANRPNQYNAWGSTEWENQPVWDNQSQSYQDRWAQTETLNPYLEGAAQDQMGLQEGRSALASRKFDDVIRDQANPLDFDQYGDPIQMDFDPNQNRQSAEDASYGRQTSRLDPQYAEQQSRLETQLMNQGLRSGDQAYDSSMDSFNRSRNDAYEQARMGSTLEGRDEASQSWQQGMQQNQLANMLRGQGMEEDMAQRGYSLDEINKLLQGQQVQGSAPSGGAGGG